MLPTNVMSFMKKMVAPEEPSAVAPHHHTAPDSSGSGTFGKIRQTLSTSLMTAQDKVTKLSPRPSLVPEPDPTPTIDAAKTAAAAKATAAAAAAKTQSSAKPEPGKPPSRAGACRVCLKSFKPEDFSKTCYECQQRVCEDCASYSKQDENEDAHTWRCSVCRRKMASRVCIQQDSVDSMLEVPMLEALQRRHSDVKLGSTNQLTTTTIDFGLAPPRSPELRRHSDVSPASLKELEKLKGGKTPTGDGWGKGQSVAPSRSNSPPRRGEFDGPASRMGSRRHSRVARQHSYDGEVKVDDPVGGSQTDLGLMNIPVIPRRASAYDVFAPGILAQASQQAMAQQQQQPNIGPAMSQRRGSFRIPQCDDSMQMSVQNDNSPSPDHVSSPVLMVDDSGGRMRRRGSQLPDIAALRDRGALPATIQLAPQPFQPPALEDLEAPRRQGSMDGEAIKIVIHDVDSGPICASKRRVVLRRDPTDKAHRTRGFGMRVVGGKTGADGRLFAYIVWTVPGGPAEKGGLQQGDKILEWNSVSLIDRSFEEVCAIMDRTGDVIELLVEHATDFRMCDLLDEHGPPGSGGGSGGGGGSSSNIHQSGPRKSGDGPVGLGLAPDTESTDKSPSSPTRRKLPKTPEQLARERTVTGRIQLQVWYHSDRLELVVSLMAGDDLVMRDDSMGFGNLPEAFAKVNVLPTHNEPIQTEVSAPSPSPIWNSTITFNNIRPETLMDRCIEVSLWDLVPHTESVYMGECLVDLQKAFLDDHAMWYRLEDPHNLRAASMLASRSPNVSPRGSFSVEHSGGGGRMQPRPPRDHHLNRSISDDVDSIGEGQSLLHPDHAWAGGSRRGSSQSETLEVEVYQLGKDFSRSLPGSRRSSFQDREQQAAEAAALAAAGGGSGAETPPSVNVYLASGRRRSSCVRRDPDEILRTLKSAKGELGRTMSLQAAAELKRAPSTRRSSCMRKESIVEPHPAELGYIVNHMNAPSSDDDAELGRRMSTASAARNQWRGSGSLRQSRNSIVAPLSALDSQVVLGPGQIQPKGYRLTSERYGELKLGLSKVKGTVEVEVISARNIVPADCETLPDTYVKCYMKDGDRLRQKKKTRVIRHSAEPVYQQSLKYQTGDLLGRNLVIMVWQKCVGFEHNQGLGGAELSIAKMNMVGNRIGGWYPLFPMHSFGFDSNDSP